MVRLLGTTTNAGRCRASAAVIFLCLCAVSSPGTANTGGPNTPKVLYLRSANTPELDEKLIHYLRAHLSSDFDLQVVDASPFGNAEEPTRSTVREVIETHGAVAAFQSSADGKSVAVTAPEISLTPWSIVVPGEIPGSANWCESVAVLVLSDIAALVPPPPSVAPPVPESAPLVMDVVSETVPDPPSPPERETSVSIVAGSIERASRPSLLLPVRLGIALGYAPAWQMSDRSMLHGVEIEVDAYFGSYLRIALQSDVAQKTDVSIGSGNATLRRFPLRALLYGSLPLKDFVLAVGAGFVWAPTYLGDLPHVPADSETDRVQHPRGGAVQFLAEYWIVRGFGIRCAGGVDMFTDEIRLSYENSVVLRVDRVGAALFLGVTGRFVLWGGKGK